MTHILNLNQGKIAAPRKTIYTPATEGQQAYLKTLAAGFGEALPDVARRFGIDAATLTFPQAQTLIDTLKAELAPDITCRVCNEKGKRNAAGLLLCPACLGDLDAARAKIEARRTRVFSDLDAAHERYVTVLDASEPAVQSWWEKILTKRSALDETESDALIERAWQAQGRATALIAAWRVWGEESAALGRELDALRAGQEEINLATLEQEGVL